MKDEIQKVILGTNEALRVTADGEFIWQPEADAMIEEGDFTSSPAMRHILRALRKALAAPVPTNFRHCGGPDNVLCAGQCKPALEAMKQWLEALDVSQALCESWKSNHHTKVLAAYDDLRAAIEAVEAAQSAPVQEHLTGLDIYLDPNDGLKPKRYPAAQPAPVQEPYGYVWFTPTSTKPCCEQVVIDW